LTISENGNIIYTSFTTATKTRPPEYHLFRAFMDDILLADTYIIAAFGLVVNNRFIERGGKVKSLKELRESVGMSQHDVAMKLDVTDVAVSRWECGKSNPLRKYRERMAAIYNVPVADIDHILPPIKSRRKVLNADPLDLVEPDAGQSA